MVGCVIANPQLFPMLLQADGLRQEVRLEGFGLWVAPLPAQGMQLEIVLEFFSPYFPSPGPTNQREKRGAANNYSGRS
eukprot:507830-Amphidinium_carterae.3